MIFTIILVNIIKRNRWPKGRVSEKGAFLGIIFFVNNRCQFRERKEDRLVRLVAFALCFGGEEREDCATEEEERQDLRQEAVVVVIDGRLLVIRCQDYPPRAPRRCYRCRLLHASCRKDSEGVLGLDKAESWSMGTCYVLGGGYLFGLPIGFLADSIGATLGSVAAFLLGRTLGRPYIISKMNDYPDFQAVAVAIERSGFKIVLLLRLAPLVPFCLLNYFLSVTPIGLAEYTMASWLGMMPITLVLVYVGTTLDDLADVTHGWSEASTAHWGTMVAGLAISAILMVCVTREAKAALQKALAENLEAEDILVMPPSPWLPSLLQPSSDLRQPLMIKIET